VFLLLLTATLFSNKNSEKEDYGAYSQGCNVLISYILLEFIYFISKFSINYVLFLCLNVKLVYMVVIFSYPLVF
jgi:hypothetical protein